MQGATEKKSHVIQNRSDVLSILKNYMEIVFYGTGEVANWFWDRYEDQLNSFRNIIVCKTDTAAGEIFRGKTVSDCSGLEQISGDSSAVVVLTHENVHEQIVSNIKKYYEGDIYLLSEDYSDSLKHINIVENHIDDGALSITYVDIPNMGDQLNKLIIKELYHKETYNEAVSYSNMTGIGSLMEALFCENECADEVDYPIYVWGTGFNCDVSLHGKKPVRKNIKYCCVRGYDSKKKLEDYYGEAIKCSVGDPGLLAYYLQEANITKRFSIGIIPHWRENELSIVNDLYRNYANPLLINLRNPPELVLHQIAECETIITSSLHGAVVADAFGIPNVLVKVSDMPSTDGFKYGDYYSVFGQHGYRLDLRLTDLPSIENIRKNYSIEYSIVKKVAKDIYDSFPYM